MNALGEPEISESQEDEDFDDELYSEQNSPLPATTIATT